MKAAVLVALVVLSVLGLLFKVNPVKLFFRLAFGFIVLWTTGYLIIEALSG